MQKKSEFHVSLTVRAKATDRVTSTEKTMAIWNFVFYMNSKRVLAQENNVWLAVQFYAWRRIWGEFTSDERAVNGSSSG
ncbi:hypothetical protein SL267_36520 [Serratia marcescens]|nr:hypothetical protein SL267_36520 [Serratia marcescens]